MGTGGKTVQQVKETAQYPNKLFLFCLVFLEAKFVFTHPLSFGSIRIVGLVQRARDEEGLPLLNPGPREQVSTDFVLETKTRPITRKRSPGLGHPTPLLTDVRISGLLT